MLHPLRFFILACLTFVTSHLPLCAEIYEIRLTIENMECHFCSRSVIDQLKVIPGLQETKIWPSEGIGLITWKNDAPFQCIKVFKTFYNSQFLLKNVFVDVEGVIHEKKGATILESLPDGSIFYIDNREDPQVRALKDGQNVRLQGRVSSQQGFNFLLVVDALPPVMPDIPATPVTTPKN